MVGVGLGAAHRSLMANVTQASSRRKEKTRLARVADYAKTDEAKHDRQESPQRLGRNHTEQDKALTQTLAQEESDRKPYENHRKTI